MASDTRIGFLGLGGMGRGIVRNLLAKGYVVTAFDRNPAAVKQAVDLGATRAASVAEAAKGCDILMLCLSTAEDVETVLLGEGGALALMRSGAMLIDHTTTNPDTVSRLSATAVHFGIRFLEAPLTRTPEHAWDGKVNILLGASASDREGAASIFSCYAENVFHVGEAGAAIRLKLIHNYIALANVATWSEGLALAAKEGLDLRKIYEVISSGGANSGMFQIYAPKTLDGDFTPVMSLANGAKDLRYYVRWAESAGVPTFISNAVYQCYQLAKAIGHGEEGCQAIIKPLEQLLGVEARVKL